MPWPGCPNVAHFTAVDHSGAANPRVKVLATVLSPSDQHEADLTNLILAWYHTGLFTAVYQERHGRR